jgi:hemolysin D
MTIKMKIEAYKDLLSKYKDKWAYSWKYRHQMERPNRTPEEAEFLPAALSVQDTPVGPFSGLAMRSIGILWILALIASFIFKLDIVVSSPSVLAPVGKVKQVQALETGVVREIHAVEGQKVKKDELLISLFTPGIETDSVRLESEQKSYQDELTRAKSIIQLLDKRDGVDWGFHKELKNNPLVYEKFNEYESKKAKSIAEIQKRSDELVSAREILAKINQSIPRLTTKVNDYIELEKNGYVAKHALLDQIQALEDAQSDQKIQLSRIEEAKSSLTDAKNTLTGIVSEMKKNIQEQKRDFELKLSASGQELKKYKQRDQLMELRAPIDGVVSQMTTFTLGGVVQAAQSMMTIVPDNQEYIFEASVANKDIGHLKIGQNASIKIESYPFTQYGFLTGVISSIAADASIDEKKGLFYKVNVKIPVKSAREQDFPHQLIPGMAATVEVNIGKRRVIEYFLNPFLESVQEAIRER